MDYEQEKDYIDETEDFSLDEILREYGGNELSPEPETEPSPEPETETDSAPEPEEREETEEDIGRTIGDEVRSALREQEEQRTRQRHTLQAVQRRNRRAQKRNEKAEQARERERIREQRREEKAAQAAARRAEAEAERAREAEKVVPLRFGEDQAAPVNAPEGKKLKKVPLHAVPKLQRAPEEAPEEALEKVKKGYFGVRVRCLLALVISAAMTVLSLGQAFRLWSPEKESMGFVLLLAQLAVVLLCGDVVYESFRDVGKGRTGLGLTVTLMNALTLIDGVAFLAGHRSLQFLPYCAVSGLAMTALLWAKALEKQAGGTVLRPLTGGVGRRILTVEGKLYLGKSVVMSSDGETDGFVGSLETLDRGRRIMSPVAVLLFLLTAALAAVICTLGKEGGSFLHLWSCMLCASLPLSAAVVFALPFARLTRALRREGAYLAGWKGAQRLASAPLLDITDNDLFPEGRASLNGIKLLGRSGGDAVAYTAAVLRESGCCLTGAFEELRREQFAPQYRAEGFRMLEGGMEGRVNGDHVICGTAEFMRINGVPLPQGTQVESAVFTAVDGELAGIFAITYKGAEKIGDALDTLLTSDVQTLLTARDFNLTYAMVADTFDVDTGEMEIPYVDNAERVNRADIGGTPAAVLTKSGLVPKVHAVLGARKLLQVLRGNLLLTLLGSLVALAVTGYLAFIGETGTLVPGNVLAFLILWFVPCVLCSSGVTRY